MRVLLAAAYVKTSGDFTRQMGDAGLILRTCQYMTLRTKAPTNRFGVVLVCDNNFSGYIPRPQLIFSRFAVACLIGCQGEEKGADDFKDSLRI